MLRVGILDDARITPPPGYTAIDTQDALTPGQFVTTRVGLDELARLDRERFDVVALPYLEGSMEGPPLAGLLRFHAQGGGLVFLGDTPNTGPSFPYRNSLAPDFRLTKCRDPLVLRGLSEAGREILGKVPDLGTMIGHRTNCIRTTAYPPDECIILVEASAHFKALGPVVLIERRHPRFLGARAAVVGFDGGEPRENIQGVCDIPWTPDYGMLDRTWSGINHIVQRLVQAVAPRSLGAALEFEPCSNEGTQVHVNVRIRNLGDQSQPLIVRCESQPSGRLVFAANVLAAPHAEELLNVGTMISQLGPTELSARVFDASGTEIATVSRTHFAGSAPPPLAYGFSTYRAFRQPAIDDAFRDFVRHTAQLGMQYVRLAFSWEELEPEPGNYDWRVADQMLNAATEAGLPAYIWVFPVARGAGLGDGGIPAWALKEPSIDRFGKPGNFPCIWSPFYCAHYFTFLEALTRRYANDPRVVRFVYDFGNSDFAYCYHYYGDRGDIFDYSPHEQKAFARWLEDRRIPLASIAVRWGQSFDRYEDVPVPLSEQTAAWLLYESFRVWGVYEGVKAAGDVVRRIAPDKAPPDPPGHGLGSIADISTYLYHVQSRHWDEVARHPAELTEAHNMGRLWGGEAWQVGAHYKDYDEALFQSVRLGASYLTIPGPDLGLWGEHLARIAMIRRTLAGARRAPVEIAILDHTNWDQFGSLAQIGVRLDQPVDLLSRTTRFDYAIYKLLVLPPDESLTTGRGVTSILPLDRGYYENILAAVAQGLNVLVFPKTGRSEDENPLQNVFGIEDVTYGPREQVRVDFPASWGGGSTSGQASIVCGRTGDEPLLTDEQGRAVCLFRRHGRGGFILCGFDARPDSFDAGIRYDTATRLDGHTLARLASHLGIHPATISTDQMCMYKEAVFKDERDFLLLYSHQAQTCEMNMTFHSRRKLDRIMDLATGQRLRVTASERPGWYEVTLSVEPLRGYYFVLQDN